jgi:hypothetical protein
MSKTRLNIDTLAVIATQADAEKRKLMEELGKARMNDIILSAQNMEYYAKFVETFDEEHETHRPFPTRKEYPLIWQVNDRINEKKRCVINKGRRAMLSWLGTLRQSWRAWRVNLGIPDIPTVYGGGIMSIGEDEAVELITRCKVIHNRLPTYFREFNPARIKTTEILYAGGGRIKAFPLRRQGPRSFGFTEVFFDEMAFQEAVRSVWMGMIPTLGAAGVVLAVSTPNGRGNLFYDIWHNKNDRYDQIERIWIPFDAHPDHDEQWLRVQSGTLTQKEVAREYYGSFASYAGEPVWDQFKREWHVASEDEAAEWEIDLNRPIYIGYDLGYHFPAATVWQRNTKDQWIGFLEYQDYDCDFETFCENLREKLVGLYGDRRRAMEIHCLPQDAKNRYHQRARSGAANDHAQVKKTFGFGARQARTAFCPAPVGTRDNEAPRLKETRKLWKRRADDLFGIRLHPRMELFIEGCDGGYCYPPEKGGEQPSKNEHSHPQDSAQTVFSSNPISRPERQKKTPGSGRKSPSRIGGRTGL